MDIKKEKAKLIIDFFHRIIMHHVLWFSEVQHQFGKQKALEGLGNAYKLSYKIQMKRLSNTLNFELSDDDNIPLNLLNMDDEKLEELRKNLAINWLANDGIWFLTIENMYGMHDAKRCNDSCWGQFSPFEAWSISKILNLPANSGLEGLKNALNYRMYAFINKQEITDETNNSFVFKNIDCRVQSARKQKGLDDYPCKSAGIVEYRSFAETIDKRIKTECLNCPPDKTSDNVYCSWKFYIED